MQQFGPHNFFLFCSLTHTNTTSCPRAPCLCNHVNLGVDTGRSDRTSGCAWSKAGIVSTRDGTTLAEKGDWAVFFPCTGAALKCEPDLFKSESGTVSSEGTDIECRCIKKFASSLGFCIAMTHTCIFRIYLSSSGRGDLSRCMHGVDLRRESEIFVEMWKIADDTWRV